MTRTGASVSVDNGTGFELIDRAAIRTARLTIVGDIEKHSGVMAPKRHFWIRAKRRQIAGLEQHFDERLASADCGDVKRRASAVIGPVGIAAAREECLDDPRVASVLVVGRTPCGVKHPKVTEVLHRGFTDFTALTERFRPIDACFFCLGVSAVGLTEEAYRRVTRDLTLAVARTLAAVNPGSTFCYISGQGADTTERGRSMWARVKGRTENALLQMGFKYAYNFRPGVLTPTKGLKNTLKYYHYLGWLLPIIERVFPRFISTLRELGQAMIGALVIGYEAKVLEVTDIKKLAARYSGQV